MMKRNRKIYLVKWPRFENEIKSMSRLGNLNILGSQNIVKMYNHMLVQSGIYSHIIILMELAFAIKSVSYHTKIFR